MDILSKIKEICGKYFSQIILIAVTVLVSLFLIKSIQNNVSVRHEYENNVIALTSEIETWKTKNDELVAEKTILQGDIDLLKYQNEDLYDQVKRLKARPKEVVYVETEIINDVHDTTYVVEKDSSYIKKNFDFSNQWRELAGYIEYDKQLLNLAIEKDITKVDFTVAIKDSKVYVTSNNPYIQYNNIQGVTIPKKKPTWFVGIGPQFGAGYGLINNKFDIYAGVGVSFNFNLLSF